MHRTKAAPVVRWKALDDGEGGAEGVFEALVSVFGNVDHYGERVVKGAFSRTLEKWRESGDPIPVVFSHQWQNLDALIGKADPGDVTESEEGLLVKGQLDLEDDFARRVWRKMRERTLREFSFAYDVLDSKTVEVEGRRVTDLLDLDLIEVGPTLKGVNPATELLTVKALAAMAPADALDLDAKAGRVLSKANEQRLRDARKSIDDVLNSLPAAEPEKGRKAETAADDDLGATLSGVAESLTSAASAIVSIAEKISPKATEPDDRIDGDGHRIDGGAEGIEKGRKGAPTEAERVAAELQLLTL